MKIVLTAVGLLLVSVVLAQQVPLQKQVRLKKGVLRIDTIMQRIHRQTALKFAFNSKQIQPSRQVSLSKPTLTVEAILLEIEQATGARFKVIGEHIVLKNQPVKQTRVAKPAAKKITVRPIRSAPGATTSKGKGKVVPKIKQKLFQQAITHKRQAPQANQQAQAMKLAVIPRAPVYEIRPHADLTLRRVVVYDRVRALNVSAQPAISNPWQRQADSAVTATGSTPRGQRSFWMVAGLYADELFYPNARLVAGYKGFYGMVSWNAGAYRNYVRYGVGYKMDLDAAWRLHLTGSVGFTGATYLPGSSLPQVKVEDNLYKISLLAEKRVGRRIHIQVGPVLNALRVRYFVYDQQGKRQPVAVGGLLPAEMDGDKTYTSVEPPYSLLNTYKKETTGNWKAWIGAEVGVYYPINFSFRK